MVIKSYPKEKDSIKVPRFEERAGFTTSKQRSNMISKIRGKNSVPELLLRRARACDPPKPQLREGQQIKDTTKICATCGISRSFSINYAYRQVVAKLWF